jgi:hypothetical protein
VIPFPLPMVFVAWATAPGKDWEGGSIGGGLIRPCLNEGFPTVALELGQFTAQHVEWCHAEGLFVVAWGVVDANLAARLAAVSYLDAAGRARGPDGVMVQVEGDGQYDGAVAGLRSILGVEIPKALVTTYGGMVDPAAPRDGKKYTALKALGVEGCFVECYASDQAVSADLDRMLGQGVIYGIPVGDLVPVCGVFRGERPSAYTGLTRHGRNFALYLAETMSTLQWEAWGAVPPVIPPLPPAKVTAYWQLRAGASLLHEEKAITYASGQTGLGKMIVWMGSNGDLIRRARAVSLARISR